MKIFLNLLYCKHVSERGPVLISRNEGLGLVLLGQIGKSFGIFVLIKQVFPLSFSGINKSCLYIFWTCWYSAMGI